MIKKITILFCFLGVGFLIYLIVPLPHSSSTVSENEFPPEMPTEFRPDGINREKCQDEAFYIRQVQVGYADSEIIDERCASLQTELANAAIDGNLPAMRSLLKKGASAKSPAFSKHSSDAFVPVITAAWAKQTEAVKLLLDNGADVNSHYSCCMSSKSLLMVAVTMNDAATTKLMLARNADLDFKDEYSDEKWTVFDEAKRTGNPVILEMLYGISGDTITSRAKFRLTKLSNLFQ